MPTNKDKGRFGERLAALYLKRKGYKIIQTNWTCRWGELDIIAEKDTALIFVEVKYRTSDKYGLPIESVNYYKIKHVLSTINRYLMLTKGFNRSYRLDVLSILKVGEKYDIKHYESITSYL